MFFHIQHLIINTAKQINDKIFSSHRVLLIC
jgi:hypothetical protein